MQTIRIECDQRFLKPHSEIERVFKEHGRFDATEIATRAAGPDPIFVEVDDETQAHNIAEGLNRLTGVRATVNSLSNEK
jgi:hypothetical protein